MVGQRMPHLECAGIVDRHGGMLSAGRESPAVMREGDIPDLSRVDRELKNIPARELVSIAQVIGKKRRRSG